MQRYVFMTMAVGDGYGGLEHRASTALICARADLPVKGQKAMSDGYRTFLGLCSHEYFHTWNVKRIKPANFAPYELQQRNLYAAALGIRRLYQLLRRLDAGAQRRDRPARLFQAGRQNCQRVLRGSGRHKQSIAESSFDAWTKYYRQDENAPNAIVSYYTKGSLVALAFDLTIRAQDQGQAARWTT